MRAADLGQEGPDERPELLRSLHDLGVLRAGQARQAALGEEVEHLGGVIDADEVLGRRSRGASGGGERADFVIGPARPAVPVGCEAGPSTSAAEGVGTVCAAGQVTVGLEVDAEAVVGEAAVPRQARIRPAEPWAVSCHIRATSKAEQGATRRSSVELHMAPDLHVCRFAQVTGLAQVDFPS